LIPKDERRPRRLLDSRRQADGELSDSDDEGEGGRKDHSNNHDADPEGGILGKIPKTVGINAPIGADKTHGAGPSGHMTAVRVLPASDADTDKMDIDGGSEKGNTIVVGGATNESASMEVDKPPPLKAQP
jgi:histone deacetylase 1/2